MDIRQRLTALRAEMAERNLDAYVIASADPHQSEYPPAHWLHRAWISGFGGSAGTVVVTATTAGLWTDFRYFLQAEHELAGSGIELFRMGEPDVPDYPAWLAAELDKGSTVGCDESSFSLASFRSLRDRLTASSVELVAGDDLVGLINPDRPPLPANPIEVHDVRFAGLSRGEKLSAIRSEMTTRGADWNLICTLDDIAWLLNIRGNDVPFNPVAVAHCLVGKTDAQLFLDPRQVSDEIRRELASDGVEVLPYQEVEERLAGVKGAVLLSPTQVSVGMANCVPDGVRVIEELNLTSIAKAQKNPVELEHVRKSMIRDGAAMVRFLHWLEGAVGSEDVTEVSAAAKLREFRALGENFVGEAFSTISAYRGHAALPHYFATEESDVALQPAGIYLVDSGAQYLDGTTDITRTVSFDAPGDEARRDYTLVLKGHIGLSTLRFPKGTTGSTIDVIAREHLWRERMNFGHGTGHGVGFYLNVHEGPQRISAQHNDTPLMPGMIISNEPGLYRAELYGIRIENLVVVAEDQATEFGSFLEFETVTLCPYHRQLIDVDLLTETERQWVDDYHRLVRDRLLGHLDGAAADWLDAACEPL